MFIVVLAVLLVVGTTIYLGGDEVRYYSGIVVRVEADTIVIRGERASEYVIRINEMTRVSKGRNLHSANSIAIGDRMIVEGIIADDGQLIAQNIRILISGVGTKRQLDKD